VKLNKYRRIEVKAFSRRVTIVSGEWPRDLSIAKPLSTEDDITFDDTNLCESVEPDSPEGQVILIEAVRSLERRLAPEARATIRVGQDTFAVKGLKRDAVWLKLQSFYQIMFTKALRFARKEK
jgi:hypothetical protein